MEELSTPENYPQLMLESQLCFPLYAAARKIVNAYTPFLKPLGLTYTQYIVFLSLWEWGEMTVGEICRRLHLDNGTITPLLKKMAREGYLTQERDGKDGRVVRLRLTEKGWEMRQRAKEIPFQVGKCVPLPGEDALALHRLLHQLLESEGEF